MSQWLVAAAIGFVSGVLSGAFGIGGGIVTTPGVRLVLGAPALVSVGTPLPVIVPGAITGAISYARNGLGNVRAGVVLGVSGAATAVLGAFLADYAGGTIVLLLTAALVFWAAGDTLSQALMPRRGATIHPVAPPAELPDAMLAEERPPVEECPPVGLPLVIGVGVVTGLYSGFLGLGGGFVLIPMLTRWARFPIKHAIGTSLVAVSLLAIPGTIAHALLGHVDWILAFGLMIGVVPGAIVGARITFGSSQRAVSIGFAVMLLAIGVWLAASELAPML